MAEEIRVTHTEAPLSAGGGIEPSLGELLKELLDESTTLVKQEVSLAKAEITDTLSSAGKDAAMLAVGGGVLLVGALVLTAFLVLLLGLWMPEWLSALIVGVVFTIIGAAMLMKAKSNLTSMSFKPDTTLQTLKDDQRWAKREAQQVKQDLT